MLKNNTNAEHPTSNAEQKIGAARCGSSFLRFEVGCSTLNVRCSRFSNESPQHRVKLAHALRRGFGRMPDPVGRMPTLPVDRASCPDADGASMGDASDHRPLTSDHAEE